MRRSGMDRVIRADEAARRPRQGGYALAAAALLCAGAAAHLWYLLNDCPLDLSGDEAHYWEWARRLDWSYYSKGPLVAYIIAGSRALLGEWSERMVGHEALAVRIPAILLSLGTGIGLYVLTVQTLRAPRLALAAVALTFTIPILAVGAVLMTIDAPLAFLYMWTLIAVERGLRGSDCWPWSVAGALIALGIMAKYTMVLIFPTVVLALLVEPSYRAALRRPGPYLAALIGVLGFVPILVWNSQHNWVSFRHVAGQAGVAGTRTFDVLGPAGLLAGQLAVVGPVWFAAMLCAVVALWRSPQPRPHERHHTPALRLLLCATATPWLAFAAFSPLTKIQPNWPVLALLSGIIVLVCWLARLLHVPHRRRAAYALVAAGALLGGTSVVVLHFSERLMPAFAWLARREPPWNLTPVAKYDPTARLRGWSALGQAVGRNRALLPPEAFIVTDDYQTASEIAFYCPGKPVVYCLQAALGDRQSQYDIWPNPLRDADLFRGRPCLYVGTLKPELTGEDEPAHAVLRGVRLAETVEHRVRGHLVRVWPIYVCDEFAGFPDGRSRPLEKF